jgi:hypothetical protein
MNIRNLSNRTITLRDTPGNIYTVPAYSQLTAVDDALWDDTEFRRWMRFRIRDIVVESLIGGGGAFAPLNAPYVTTLSNASLSNEAVLGTAVTMSGLVASRPAASIPGRTYYVTDTNSERITRDNGSSWDDQKLSWSFVTNNSTIDSNARVAVSKGGSAIGTRRGLNFIEGSGVTLTGADNSGSERVDITVANSSPYVAPTILGPTPGGSSNGTAANTAYLALIPVTGAFTFTRLACILTTTVGGNMDMGVYYSDDEATFTRLVSKGSVLNPGTGVAIFTVGSTTITPVTGRRWYFAVAASNTPTLVTNGSGPTTLSWGVNKGSSFPLPSSLTGTTPMTGAVPHMAALI